MPSSQKPNRCVCAAAAMVIASASLAVPAREQSVWVIDSMIYGYDDPRLKSSSTPQQIAAFRAAKDKVGDCSKLSPEQAAAWTQLTELANKGVVEAQTWLGWFGMLCKVAVPDRAEPLRWAEKAAATGYVPALEVLAQLNEWPGIPGKSKEKAFAAYKAAAEGGSPAAMVWTRVALCLGNGTPKDPKAGAMWMDKARAWYRANGRAEEAAKWKDC